MASKERYNGQYKKQKQWTSKNRDDIHLVVPKGTRERWKTKADKVGKSLTQYVYDTIETGC